MVHRSREGCMRESDSAEGAIAQRVAGGRRPFKPEEEARLWIDEGVAEPVQHNSGDIAFCVKAGSAEHFHHLLTDLPLVVREGSRQQFRPAHLALGKRWKPRLCEIHEEGQNCWQVGTDSG